MLRELGEPQLLTLTLVLRGPAAAQNVNASIRVAREVMETLGLPPDRQQTVAFLIRNQFQLSQTAFRRDTGDPDIIRKVATLFSTEDELKMLCLLTVADASAAGAAALTPWKSEIVWRLFVDVYNQLTMAYGDDIIDQSETVIATLHAHRPPALSAAELGAFLEGLPRRYLTLFDAETIYEHVELCRDVGPDDVRMALKHKAGRWELTVAAIDKPYLFSNICGVLSYMDFDILRGHALTSLTSVVIDVVQFMERSEAPQEARLRSLLSDVVGGRVDVNALVREKEQAAPSKAGERQAPVIYFDNDSSQRYTVLELLAEDSPGLLYRISRSLSAYGCNVELVLIATEGHKAVDVFHLKKNDGKLSDSDQLALTEELERALR
jgi:[protein-PII] uridylyltransferase